jgi:hypothetical protein
MMNRKIRRMISAAFSLALAAAVVSRVVLCVQRFKPLKITSWNVQTFFDEKNVGTEYSEFVKSRNWGEKMYRDRLIKLSECIKKIDGDVLILEEIENEKVLRDILNFLGADWNPRKNYRFFCFAKSKNASIGVGIISRIKIDCVKIHGMDVRTAGNSPRSLRPIVEATVWRNGRRLKIFANHWKSKSGGAELTEKWRNMEESILAEKISLSLNEKIPVVAAGDFNRDILDFFDACSGKVFLRRMKCGKFSGEGIFVKSPWFSGENLVQPGSYFFRGEWSRIDNFFFAGDVEVKNFFAETDGPWCAEENFVPKKYSLWNGNGYSDHLPISCRVEF